MDNLLKKCNLEFVKDYTIRAAESRFYFPGQQFEVVLKGEIIGTLGVVHPSVLRNFSWYHPTVMWELEVAPLEKAFTDSYK